MSSKRIYALSMLLLALLLASNASFISHQFPGSFQVPFAKGLVGFFPLYNNLSDYSENDQHLLYSHRQDYLDLGLQLSGDPNNYLEISNWKEVAKGKTERTVALWVKPLYLDQMRPLVWDGTETNPTHPTLTLWVNSAASLLRSATFKGPYKDTAFHWGLEKRVFAALTVSYKKGIARVYVNGNLEKEIPFDPQDVDSSNQLFIGRGFNPESQLVGIVSSLSIWDRPLSESEMGLLYLQQNEQLEIKRTRERFILGLTYFCAFCLGYAGLFILLGFKPWSKLFEVD